MSVSDVPSLLPPLLVGTGWECSLDLSQEESQDFSREKSWVGCRPSEQHDERSCIMTMVSLADCCRHLGIDPKTLRRWLVSAPFTGQPHPHDARRHGLTEEQLRWLAAAHHRSLPVLPQEAPQPAPSAEPLALPDDLLDVFVALRALPAQLAALQAHLADLTHQFSHLAEPASTTRSRAGVTSKATNSRRRSRGRAERRSQPQRPSSAQVVALVEYAGEGH